MAFLNFYAASSCDSIAALMHDFSSTKLARIESAETYYLRAIQATSECYIDIEPSVKRLNEDQQIDSPEDCPAELRTAYRQGKFIKRGRMSPRERHSGSEDTRPTPTQGSFTRNFSRPIAHAVSDEHSQNPSFPSPKLSRSISLMNLELGENHHNETAAFSPIEEASEEALVAQIPPPTPPETPLPSISSNDDSTPIAAHKQRPHYRFQDVSAGDEAISPDPLQDSDHIVKVKSFKTNTATFINQLHAHLNKLRELKSKTEAAQVGRSAKRSTINTEIDSRVMQSSRSYWSFNESKSGDDEKLKRIEEGRARQWKRERVDVRKYQQLAETALAELSI